MCHDQGVLRIISGIIKLADLKKLVLNNNLKIKSKTRDKALQAIVVLLDQEYSANRLCQLEHFSLTNTGGGKGLDSLELGRIIERTLSNNDTLISLDLSGHHAGDVPVTSLSKSLPLATKLKRLVFDDNDTSAAGLRNLQVGISRCASLVEYPIPTNDILELNKSQAVTLSTSADSIATVMASINKSLRRNANPKAVMDNEDKLAQYNALSNLQQQELTVCQPVICAVLFL